MIRSSKDNLKNYHATEIESNSGEVEWQHSEEVKSSSKTINITAKCLFSISISNLSLKEWNLIQANISPLTNLYVLMMCNISLA